jgi:hypothetical protein
MKPKLCCDCGRPLDCKNNALCSRCARIREAARRANLKVEWISDYKLDTFPCVRCGATDIQWHHIDPESRVECITTIIGHLAPTPKNRLFFETELLKCESLCHPCHVDAHLEINMARKALNLIPIQLPLWKGNFNVRRRQVLRANG